VENRDPLAIAEEGKQEYAKGNYESAVSLFVEAAKAFESVQDQLNAAEMKNNQSVVLLQWGKAKQAFEVVEGTEEVFEKAGDKKRQGMSVGNRAAALEGMKKYDDALVEYERAASLLEEAGEGDMHSIVRKAAANLNLKRGRFNASQMDVYDSLRLVEKPNLTQRFMKFLMRIGLIR